MNLPVHVAPEVRISHGLLWTTSLNIAQVFGRQHKNVLDAIKRLDCSEEFARLNFKPGSYADANNQNRPLYDITRHGFTFLVMGFTGKEAARWKEAYIAAFNRLAEDLAEARREVETRAQATVTLTMYEWSDLQAKLIDLQDFKLAVLEAKVNRLRKPAPKPLREEVRAAIREKLALGESRRAIAAELGCSDSSVYLIQREMRGGLGCTN